MIVRVTGFRLGFGKDKIFTPSSWTPQQYHVNDGHRSSTCSETLVEVRGYTTVFKRFE